MHPRWSKRPCPDCTNLAPVFSMLCLYHVLPALRYSSSEAAVYREDSDICRRCSHSWFIPDIVLAAAGEMHIFLLSSETKNEWPGPCHLLSTSTTSRPRRRIASVGLFIRTMFVPCVRVILHTGADAAAGLLYLQFSVSLSGTYSVKKCKRL